MKDGNKEANKRASCHGVRVLESSESIIVNVEADLVCKRVLSIGCGAPVATAAADVVSPLPSNEDGAMSPSCPPELARSPMVRQQARPGAYPVQGINGSSHLSYDDDDDDNDEERPQEAAEENMNNSSGEYQTDSASTLYDATLVDSKELRLEEKDEPTSDRNNYSQARRRNVMLVDATVLQEQSAKNEDMGTTRKMYLVVILLCTLVVLIVTAVVLFAFRDSNNQNSVVDAASGEDGLREHSHIVRYPPFREDLQRETIRALADPLSPASKANAWMWNDPNLNIYSEKRQLQRFGLAAIYYALNGDNWIHRDGWLDYEVHECDWFSNKTLRETPCEDGEEDDDETFVSLQLSNNGLSGQLSSEVHYVSAIKYADLSFNNLHGMAPALDERSFVLEIILVHNNQLDGLIVAKNAHVPRTVRTIDISNNRLQGHTVNTLALFPGLEVLRASGNLLTGTLDGSRFQALANLTVMDISDNLLTGPLPTEMSAMTSLQELDMSSNGFTGIIPAEWTSLEQLKVLNVTDTLLTGAIPEAFCENANNTQPTDIVADCDTLNCCA